MNNTLLYILKTQVLSLTDIKCSRIPFPFGVLSFFGENCMNLVVSEILIWSTSSKLRTYDTDLNFTGLRITISHKIFEINSGFHVK